MPKGFVPLGSEFQVNTYITSDQYNPSIATLADGGFIVTWESLSQDGSAYGIYGQRYDAAGASNGVEFQVNSYTTYSQFQPSTTALSDGGFVVTWDSQSQDGSDYSIYAQRYDAAGATSGAEFKVNTYAVSYQIRSAITALSDGGFVVTWESYGQDGSNASIYGQRFDAAGATNGAEFKINTFSTNSQLRPSITALTDGGFVVAWHSYGQDGSSSGIYGQRYDSAGATSGTEFKVNTFTTSGQNNPSITALSDGGFVVTWESFGQDGSFSSIHGQRYDVAGATSGTEFQVNSYTTDTQSFPTITALADGGFVVTWASNGQDGSSHGIYGQRFDAAGAEVGAEFQVNSNTTDTQSIPSITALPDGGFVVTWASDGQDGIGYGIFAQQFAAQLFGTMAGDTIIDKVGADWMHGQGGADVLKGLGGADTIKGGDGNDKLFGGKGADDLSGGKGADTLTGGIGRDTLTGGGRADKLFGGKGADDLSGGRGSDALSGGNGADKLTGGAGDDKFVFKLGFGRDRITDFQDDVDSILMDKELWGGGMTKQQVIDTYASVDSGDILFDFGTDELRLKGITDLDELKDDMAFL